MEITQKQKLKKLWEMVVIPEWTVVETFRKPLKIKDLEQWEEIEELLLYGIVKQYGTQ